MGPFEDSKMSPKKWCSKSRCTREAQEGHGILISEGFERCPPVAFWAKMLRTAPLRNQRSLQFSCVQAIDLLSMKEVGLTQTRLQFKARRGSVAEAVDFIVAATRLGLWTASVHSAPSNHFSTSLVQVLVHAASPRTRIGLNSHAAKLHVVAISPSPVGLSQNTMELEL